jgi:hypothetical protein
MMPLVGGAELGADSFPSYLIGLTACYFPAQSELLDRVEQGPSFH